MQVPLEQETQVPMRDELIDLGLGHPANDLLPTELFRRAAEMRLTGRALPLLQYGFGQGSISFREALGDFLAGAYGMSVPPETLLVTNGASQALDLVCTVLTKPGDTVFVEEPSYFLALGIFAEHRLNVVSLPVDGEGLQTEALEQALADHTPVFLYTIPTFQNPSGVSLSPKRRERLVELSRVHDFFIVADEVYQLLNFTETRPAPLAAFAQEAKVLSLGSFSKILAPGLRLGWIQASETLLEPLINSAMLTSGGGLSPFTSGLVKVILKEGWQAEHLENIREVYAERARALVGALQTELPEVTFEQPEGGYFIWLKLHGVDTGALHPRAERHGVSFQTGSTFSSQNSLHDALRLSFSYYEPEKLQEGVRRLHTTLKTANSG